MRILAIDTSASTATICLAEDAVSRGAYTIQTNAHSTTILPMISSLLDKLHLTIADCDLLAAAAGPGSFTGIRIGVSTIKGLAFSAGIPCVGVSSLAAIAYGMTGMNGILCPVINARRDHVYTAFFRAVPDALPERMTEDMQLSVEELWAKIAQLEDPVYASGDGYAMVHRADANRPQNLYSTPALYRIPHAYGVAMAGWEQYRNSADPSVYTGDALVPVYLRKSQAEREREERIAALGEQKQDNS